MLSYRTFDITWYWTCVILFCYKHFYNVKLTLAATFVLNTILVIYLLLAWPTILKYCLTKYWLYYERNAALSNYITLDVVGVYSYRLDWQVTSKSTTKSSPLKRHVRRFDWRSVIRIINFTLLIWVHWV